LPAIEQNDNVTAALVCHWQLLNLHEIFSSLLQFESARLTMILVPGLSPGAAFLGLLK